MTWLKWNAAMGFLLQKRTSVQTHEDSQDWRRCMMALTLDGMSGIVYVDDRQVTELSIRKMASGEEKVVVMVWQKESQA